MNKFHKLLKKKKKKKQKMIKRIKKLLNNLKKFKFQILSNNQKNQTSLLYYKLRNKG